MSQRSLKSTYSNRTRDRTSRRTRTAASNRTARGRSTRTRNRAETPDERTTLHGGLAAAGVFLALGGVWLAFFSDTLLETVGFSAVVGLLVAGAGLLVASRTPGLRRRSVAAARNLRDARPDVAGDVRTRVARLLRDVRPSGDRFSSGGRDRL
ncbi:MULTISPECIES: hypothetical protein [Halorussus]|uniref:hypothetical protein n=1 Tax=Halorussus TaxID=1070314 RepID=UPI00209D1B50|nr:hypothetical protein [Halorussus vallis]USZ75476.1 hypothetical protein NGM07_18845 [Halorussus vallis]